jgi:hypothetical protein
MRGTLAAVGAAGVAARCRRTSTPMKGDAVEIFLVDVPDT